MMIEKIALKIIHHIGTISSIIIHTILFAISFIFILLGFKSESVLLFLTTIVSLEAIYLSIFIQMSVNIQSRELKSVASDVEVIQKNVDVIQDNVEDIQEDMDEIQDDDNEDDDDIKEIKETIKKLMKEVISLRNQNIKK